MAEKFDPKANGEILVKAYVEPIGECHADVETKNIGGRGLSRLIHHIIRHLSKLGFDSTAVVEERKKDGDRFKFN